MPFAVVDGRSMALDVIDDPSIDELSGWIGPVTGTTPIAAIARVPAGRVAALGVALGPGDRVETASVERLTPPTGDSGAVRSDLSPAADHPAALELSQSGGGALADGLYRLRATWLTSAGGAAEHAWNVEVGPSIVAPEWSVAASLRGLASAADRLGSDPATPLVTPRGPAATGTSTDVCAATLGPGDDLLGIVEPTDQTVIDVRMLPNSAVRGGDVATRLAPGAVGPLSIVGLPPGGLAARDYTLIADLQSGGVRTRVVWGVCVT